MIALLLAVMLPAVPVQATSTFANPFRDGSLAVCVEFRNQADVTATTIRFKVTFYDAFDTVLDSDTRDLTGEFAPGVDIKVPRDLTRAPLYQSPQCFDFAIYPEKTRKWTVQAVKVLYTDGTVWTLKEKSPA